MSSPTKVKQLHWWTRLWEEKHNIVDNFHLQQPKVNYAGWCCPGVDNSQEMGPVDILSLLLSIGRLRSKQTMTFSREHDQSSFQIYASSWFNIKLIITGLFKNYKSCPSTNFTSDRIPAAICAWLQIWRLCQKEKGGARIILIDEHEEVSDLNKLKNQDDAVLKAAKPHLSLPQAEANMFPHELAQLGAGLVLTNVNWRWRAVNQLLDNFVSTGYFLLQLALA